MQRPRPWLNADTTAMHVMNVTMALFSYVARIITLAHVSSQCRGGFMVVISIVITVIFLQDLTSGQPQGKRFALLIN